MEIIDKLKNPSEVISKELLGWLEFAKNEGWLNPPDDYILYLPEPKTKLPGDTLNWDIHSENFKRAIRNIDFKNKKILDVASGRTWTSKEFALKGGIVTATDILTEDGVGLKTAFRYFKHFNIEYKLVRCDMNDLPFNDQEYDIVFIHASLHHSENIQKAISEMKRVCKKNGLIILSSEPVCSFYNKILKRFSVKGLEYGINETSPSLNDYLKQFKKEDIKIVKAKEYGWRDKFNILDIFGGNLIAIIKNT